jgi:MFS family permease
MLRSYSHAWRSFERGLKRFFYTCAVASFSGEAGIYALLLNLFLLRLGFGPVFVGQMAALMSIVYGLAALPASALGRRLGCGRAMLLGLCLVSVGYVAVPASGLAPADIQRAILLGTRLFVGVGWALWDVNGRPYLTGAAANEERAHVFAISGAVGPLLGLLGTLIGGAMPRAFATWQGQALTQSAPYATSLGVAALLFLPAPFVMGLAPKTRAPTRGAVVRASQPLPLATILSVLVVVALQMVAGNANQVFSNVFMDTALGVPTATVGVVKAIGQLVSVPAVLLTPLLLRRWGLRRVYVVTAFGVAASMLPVIVFPSLWAMTVSLVGLSALNIVAFAAICLFQMQVVVPEWRPAMSAAMSLAIALSSGLTSYAGGLVINSLGFRALFTGTAAVTALGALLFCILFRRTAVRTAGGTSP